MPNRHARRKQAAQQRSLKKQFDKVKVGAIELQQALALQANAKPTQNSNRLSLEAAATINAAEGDKPRTFQIVAYTGEPMRIWRYEYPVVVDLATADLTAQSIPILYDHYADANSIVGQSSSVQAVNGQIVVAGQFILTPGEDGDCARMVVAKADAGFRWQASVGGEPATVERVPAGQTIVVNGRSYSGPVCVARGLQLRETSFVVLGGDRRTSAVVAHNQDEGTTMGFGQWLAALGFPDATVLTAEQREKLEARYNAEMGNVNGSATGTTTTTGGTTTPTTVQAGQQQTTPTQTTTPAADPVLTARNRLADEEGRCNRIRQLVARYGITEIQIGDAATPQTVNAVEHAIRAGWESRDLELELLRASRTAPAVINRDRDRDCSLQALQGAMILRAGGRLDHPSYRSQSAVAIGVPDWLRAGLNDTQRNQYMEAAHRYSDMSMVDLAREACRLDGRDAPIHRSDCIRAAFSGGSLTNIFTTNINTVFIAAFMEATDSTVGWTSTTDVADFKTNERPRLTTTTGLTKHPKGGTADHDAPSDSGESYKIARYSKQLTVDEQDIINDMFEALSTKPANFARAAARLRPDLVYAILLANPTLAATARALFNSTDANLKTTSALAADKLKAAITAMRLFRENSVNLDIAPTHLIVPPTLHYTGRELLNSTTIVIAGTAGSVTERGSANTLLGDVTTLVTDSRLENGVTDPDSGTAHSGSASDWFLASNQVPTIEVAYRRGTGRSPQIRTHNLEQGQWGVGWDVVLDIGAKALEWRGLLKASA